MSMMKKILTALLLTLLTLLTLDGAAPRLFIEPHAPVAGEVFRIVVELDGDIRPQFEVPPLAAYSHSASVGRRYFLPVLSDSHWQNVSAE